MELSREKYKNIIRKFEEQNSRIEQETLLLKKRAEVGDTNIKKIKCTLSLAKANVILSFCLLFIYVIRSEKLKDMLKDELYLFLNWCKRVYLLACSKAYGQNLDIFSTIGVCLFVVIIFMLHRIINLKTTMWKFYYLENGAESRTLDRIKVFCVLECIVGGTFVLAEQFGDMPVLRTVLILVCAFITSFYLKKVLIAYQKRVTATK